MAYIYAYAPDEDDCSTIGLVGALLDEDAEFNLKAGEFGELTFTHPVDPYGKWKALVNGAILKAMVPMRLCPGLKEDGTYVAAVDRYAVSATATKAQRVIYSGSGPSGSGKKKALLKVGQVVTVTGVADASDNNSRYKVKLGKVSGWMERAGLTRTQRNVPVEQDGGGLESAEPSYAVRQQLFRIYEVNPQTGGGDPGSIEVRARRIVYDLLGNLSTYKNNGSLTCRTACENVLRSAVMPHDFAIFTDIGDSHVGFDAMNVNPIAALIDPEDGVAARWGAEIVCDDYEIYVLRRAGLDRGVRIEYAKNLIGVDVREDVSGVATAIRPAGEDKSGNPLYIGGSVVDGRHVYNGGTALPDGLRFYTAPDGAVNGAIVVRDGYDSDSPPRIHFEAVGDARVGKGSGDVTVAIARQMLVERAAALFDGGCDVPEIRMRVDFVMLGDTAEYAQYKHLEPLFVYDTVHIHDRRVGVRADIDLTELTWLVRPERVSAAEFGALTDMTASVSGWQISSVSGAKILPGTVGAGQVGDGAISARAIQADSVNADALQANSVTAGKVAAGAITAEKLDAGAVTADKLAANAVTAAKIDAHSVSAAVVQTTEFSAASANIADARIGSADIGFAQIKDANVEQLIARDAVTGRYYIRKLQVDNAQMVQATVGALVIKAGDGKYYRLDFDGSGNLTPTEVTLTQGEITAGETADGRGSIIETDLTVQDLAAANMKGVNALIDTLTAGRLYANQAFIDKLWTSEIHGGKSLEVIAGEAAMTATAHGGDIAVSDSAEAAIGGLVLYGRSEQTQAPTGKNLLPAYNLYGIRTVNGITFAPLPDGGFHVTGTSTAVATYQLHYNYNLLNIPAGTYRFLVTGSGTGFGGTNVALQLYTNTGSGLVSRIVTIDGTYTITGDTTADYARLRVETGKTVDCVIHPMMMLASVADTTYEPRSGGVANPSPALPQPIRSVGMTCGLNLLRGMRRDRGLSNGITYSDPGDGGIHIEGTAVADSYSDATVSSPDVLIDGNYPLLPAGQYIVSEPETSLVKWLLSAWKATDYSRAMNNTSYAAGTAQNQRRFVLTEPCYVLFRAAVASGTTVNVTMYPAIYRDETYVEGIVPPAWEPYSAGQPQGTRITLTCADDAQGTNAAHTALPTPNGLPGIAVSSGGNYTDADGQQWICDTIDLAAGTYTKRVGQYTFNGSEAWTTATLSGTLDSSLRRFVYRGLADVIKGVSSNAVVGAVVCDSYEARPLTLTGEGTYYGYQGISISDTAGVSIYDTTYGNTSGLAAWKAMLAANPMHCLFALATPVVTPLTEAQLTALRSLRTRAGVTVLTNDADADMDLTYATQTGGGSYVEGVRQGLDDGIGKAQGAADAAQVTADAAREDFRRVVRIDTEGLHVGDSQTSNEVMIDSESVNVVLGGRKYSKFAGDYVQFGDYQLRRSVDGGLVFKKA